MPDEGFPRSKALRRILETEGDHPEDHDSYFSSERQHTAQAFNLHVSKRDGRHAEGFPWAHYAGCKWTDEGDHERLAILFGARAVVIEGFNLGALVDEIREGKLNGVREMVTAESDLKRAAADAGPVIRSVTMHPDFEELLEEIKGSDEHDTGFARKARGR